MYGNICNSIITLMGPDTKIKIIPCIISQNNQMVESHGNILLDNNLRKEKREIKQIRKSIKLGF